MQTRTFKAPAARVFDAWTNPALFQQWWTPKSFGMSFLSCQIDARTCGGYRFVFSHPSAKEPMAFFGRYLEVTPPTRVPGRLVWTNDEGHGGGAVTTLTLEERDGQTLLTLDDPDPQPEALAEQFAQLDKILANGDVR